MKRIPLLLTAVGVVAAAMIVAVTILPGGSSAADRNHRTFTLVAQESEATLTPADAFNAPAQNAQASEDAPVYRNGKKVGLAETVITFTRVAGDDVVAMIERSIELPEGNLLFNGSAHLADLAKGAAVPVVGGTKAYNEAAGTVIMVASEDGSKTTLKFDITTK